MKVFIAGLFMFSSMAFAAHPASKMLSNSLRKGQAIMAEKSETLRNSQMCALLKKSVAMDYIGKALLGDYKQIRTDAAGIKLFLKEMPSMSVSKLFENISKADGATINVDENAYDRGNGVLEVGVTIHTEGGNAYSAKILLFQFSSGWKVIDGEYFGFSALQYLAKDIQKKLGEEYETNPTRPVSQFMKKQMSEASFIKCP